MLSMPSAQYPCPLLLLQSRTTSALRAWELKHTRFSGGSRMLSDLLKVIAVATCRVMSQYTKTSIPVVAFFLQAANSASIPIHRLLASSGDGCWHYRCRRHLPTKALTDPMVFRMAQQPILKSQISQPILETRPPLHLVVLTPLHLWWIMRTKS